MEQTEQNESEPANRRLILMAALLHTVPVICYLLARLLLKPPASMSFVMARSLWRRKHQAGAARAHYKWRHNTQL